MPEEWPCSAQGRTAFSASRNSPRAYMSIPSMALASIWLCAGSTRTSGADQAQADKRLAAATMFAITCCMGLSLYPKLD